MNLRSSHFAVAAALAGVLALCPPALAQHTFDGNILYGNGGIVGGSGTTATFQNDMINFVLNDINIDPLLGNPIAPGTDFVPSDAGIANGDNDQVSTIAYVNADACDGCGASRVFTQECYRGAVPPPSKGADWTAGWTCYDNLGTCRGALGNLVFLSGAQPTSVWTSNNTYVLQGKVWFPTGTTLTIQAGTIVIGENASAGYLVIDPGAQIFAVGTDTDPIIMTTDLDPPTPGGWGGLVIHGNAVANCADCLGGQQCTSEGGAGDFCGTNDCDNSGVLRYVRVQYAGVEISLNNELNAFTFNGVGSGTTAEYLQAHMGSDDLFEWFGGHANVNHIVGTGGADDGVDWQMGFRGTVQNAVIQFFPGIVGDKGIEADNNEFDFDAPCRSNPLIANCTFVGSPDAGHGINLRRGTDAQIFNCIVTNFPGNGLDLDDAPTGARGVNPQPLAFAACSATDAPAVGGSFGNGIMASPNPLSSQTQFTISMESEGAARLDVFDVSGRLVANVFHGTLHAGTHHLSWAPKDGVGHGMYFYRLQRNDGAETGKLVVVR